MQQKFRKKINNLFRHFSLLVVKLNMKIGIKVFKEILVLIVHMLFFQSIEVLISKVFVEKITLQKVHIHLIGIYYQIN